MRRFLQPKLTLGPVDDPFEREADLVAERVVRQLPAGSLSAVPTLPPAVQRKASEEGEPEEEDREEEGGEVVRLKAAAAPPALPGPGVSPTVAAGIHQAAGGGRPLPAPVRGAMETAFGADFRLVRVHADQRADHLNRSLGARAFTTGRDVFFRGGEYRPDSATGRRLLAHELTHVVQQGRGGGGGGLVQRAVCYVSGVAGPYEGRVAERGVTIEPDRLYGDGQRKDILDANNAGRSTFNIPFANSRSYRSDENDGPLVTKDLLKHHLAEIDHIYPEARGGGNSVRNAQVLSQYENGEVKSDDYPWTNTRTGTQYRGARVLLPEGKPGWNVARGGVLGVNGRGQTADIRLPVGSTIPQGGVLYAAGTTVVANTTLSPWMTLPQGFSLAHPANAQLGTGVTLPQGYVLPAPLVLPAGFTPAEAITLPAGTVEEHVLPSLLGPTSPPVVGSHPYLFSSLAQGFPLPNRIALPSGGRLGSPLTLPERFVIPFPLTIPLGRATSPAVDVVQQSNVLLAAPVTFGQAFPNLTAPYDLKLSAARANGLAPAGYDPL